jgi:hypothetical protein
MDQDLLKALAHFKVLLKKEKGMQVDLEKLLRDAAYGRQIMALAEESENETLVFVALSIKDKLGHLKVAPAPAPAASAAAEKPQEKKPAAQTGKYFYGPRS